ncbi:hypothetical protein GOP47_0011101 [Adiantum capillus-veneris]|uniref:Uncharacterized protein n=1 Tax=Adiantum capillus-veneris TaxID=13818 RepID=A0A9D4ZF29_ADICA|nr:hypothetical protein GOP47_0011101 [Adiantum capillus-veneris]
MTLAGSVMRANATTEMTHGRVEHRYWNERPSFAPVTLVDILTPAETPASRRPRPLPPPARSLPPRPLGLLLPPASTLTTAS